jgi:hypothetical protein
MPYDYCTACDHRVGGARLSCPTCRGALIDGVEEGRYDQPAYPDQHRMPVPRRDVQQAPAVAAREPVDAGRP